MRLRTRIGALIMLSLVTVASTLACPVCYGANDAPMTAGVSAAILVMIGITGAVLSTISAFFLMIRRRYKLLSAAQPADESPGDHRTPTSHHKQGIY